MGGYLERSNILPRISTSRKEKRPGDRERCSGRQLHGVHWNRGTLRRENRVSTLSGRRVMVTGGAGFLGRHVCDALRDHAPAMVLVSRRAEYDLTEQSRVRQLLDDQRP